MLLNQIAAFVETARRQSVSRAADALFISQPALTARLKGLEADLGAQLFVRGPRGMRLTDAGSAFLPYAVRSLETLTDGRMQVNALERGGAGRLAIGAAPAVSTYVLPALLKRFSAADYWAAKNASGSSTSTSRPLRISRNRVAALRVK